MENPSAKVPVFERTDNNLILSVDLPYTSVVCSKDPAGLF